MTLEARSITVRVGGGELLRDVSVSVGPGELVVVVGPNGAGKSTLVSVLAGDRAPATGDVRMLGRPLAAWSLVERARIRAVLGAEVGVAFPFTAEEVVLMGRTPHHRGVPDPEDRRLASEALELVDAAGLAERPFSSLSGGERQRVQLARALAQIGPIGAGATGGVGAGSTAGGPPSRGQAGTHDGADRPPRFLLLDEPTSNLDLAAQHVALAAVRAAARDGVGVLLVVHDLNLAAAYGDRLVLLDRGRVVAAGAPRDVLDAAVLEPVFGVPILVLPHPAGDRPLLVPDPRPDAVLYR